MSEAFDNILELRKHSVAVLFLLSLPVMRLDYITNTVSAVSTLKLALISIQVRKRYTEPYVGLLRSRRVDPSKIGAAGLVGGSDNCHEGMDGRGGKVGNGGADPDPEVLGVRLSNRVFRDFRSCCNSPNDCV